MQSIKEYDEISENFLDDEQRIYKCRESEILPTFEGLARVERNRVLLKGDIAK